MPALRGRRHVTALFGYVCVAIAFSWPLPLHLTTGVPGPVSGDTGLYIWNLWLFRHEIVANHAYPFFTTSILALTPRVPLTLHNYTTAADVVALPLLPFLGTVATYNLLLIGSCALAAYTMFLLARRLVNDSAAAWVAGLAFGFSPFMTARTMEHFSLVQAAPLPLFMLLLFRLRSGPSAKIAVALGAVTAWAFLSDPYYAIYCLLIGAFTAAVGIVVVHWKAAPRPRYLGSRAVIDLLLVCLAGLILGIVLSGGARFQMFGVRISMQRLYTPVLVFTSLAAIRLWLSLRPQLSWVPPPIALHARTAAVALAACVTVLSPVLYAMRSHLTERQWISPKILWRSSPAGQDLLAFFVPNPVNQWLGLPFRDGIARLPNGFVENVAALPWVLIAVIVIALAYGWQRLPRYWLVFTAGFALLTMGPFVHIGGVNTYVPTPWVLLRYVPVIGAARMPTRFAVLVALGASVLLAYALRDLRARWRRPALLTAVTGVLLLIELSPAPRAVHSAAVPSVYSIVAADPRPIRVLNLPFTLSDGLRSYGGTPEPWQFFQTAHGKPLVGGALSRLRRSDIEYYGRRRVTSVLMHLSAGRPVSADRLDATIRRAREIRQELNIGYVVINMDLASTELVAFAHAAFELVPVASDGRYHLFRTPLTPPRAKPASEAE